MATYWPYIAAFLSPVLSFLSAYAVVRLNRQHAAGQKLTEGETTWRQARLDAEAALRKEIGDEKAERMHWQLKNEGDLASITPILEDGAEASKLLAQIATTSQHHDGRLNRHDDEFKAVHQRLENMNNNLHHLSLSHARNA